MKKIFLLIAVCFYLVSSTVATPDEGMWLPLYLKKLNESKMKELGMKLSAEDIYNINNTSLKDAIVRLGRGFCTGEIVSGKGLVFTNHHCGFDAIAGLSSTESNYLKDGFWAMTQADEIPIPDFSVSRLVYIKDISDVINSAIKDLDDFDKASVIQSISDSFITVATTDNHYEAEYKSMFGNSEHYIMVYETFRDVRFVGAPPSSIGKFGGDTDNWMWPRHTGDFSILRIYTDKDGKPASYSEDNIPYKPLHFLPISLNGISENDFAMVYGFPGSTERYLTSYDINFRLNVQQPAVIEILGEYLDQMKKDMDADPEVKLELASTQAMFSNAYKYYVGQNLGLKRFNLESDYKQQEEQFLKWIESNSAAKEKYGTILSDISDQYSRYRNITPGYFYLFMGIGRLDLTKYIMTFDRLNQSLKAGDNVDSEMATLKKTVENYFGKDKIKFEREKKLLKTYVTWYYKYSKEGKKMPELIEILSKYKNDDPEDNLNEYFDDVYSKSVLFNKEKLDKFLEKPSKGTLKKESVTGLISGLFNLGRNKYRMTIMSVNNNLDKLHNKYIVALRDWKKDENFYPDANSTLRLSYGKVLPYSPRNAVYYNYFTTHYGILEKENPDDEEFIVPKKLKTILKEKDFGPYGHNDTLFVCFLTDNDITGGNSGSPVIDANGNLIGIAFDGNWESMTGDLMVNPKYNRTISVDIRYVLFVIDKFAGNKRLINELKIVEEKKAPEPLPTPESVN